jgi:hypothetical protein
MAFYIVSYDLRKPDFDYQDLYDELDYLQATRVQDSVWVLCSDSPAKEVVDSLWAHMHNQKDRLLVAEINNNWYSQNGIAKIKPLRDACKS